MKRFLAFLALIAGFSYFLVVEMPKDKERQETETKIDRMMDTMEKTEVWP